MRFTYCIIFILFLANVNSLQSQVIEEVFGDGKHFVVEEVKPVIEKFQKLKKELKKNNLESLQDALLKFDVNKISEYFHSSYDKSEIKELLRNHKVDEKLLKTSKMESYEGMSGATFYGIMISGNSHDVEINYSSSDKKAIKGLRVLYSYLVIDSSIVITSMFLSQHGLIKLPNLTIPKSKKAYADFSIKFRNTYKTMAYDEFTRDFTKLQELVQSMIKHQIMPKDRFNMGGAKMHGNLSWYNIINKKYKEANELAIKGLELDEDQEWIKTNLALSYLMLNQKEEAMKVYKAMKDKPFIIDGRQRKNLNYSDIFLADIEELEKAGIESKHFKEVEQLFQKQ